MILGIDEVGRGALAGPVFLGAVLLDFDYPPYTFNFKKDLEAEEKYNDQEFFDFELNCKIRDSKKLSAELRTIIYREYRDKVASTVFQATNKQIDTYGIGVCLSHILILLIIELLDKFDKNQKTKIVADGKIKILTNTSDLLLKELCVTNSLNFPKIQSKLTYALGIINNNSSSLFQEEIANTEFSRENKADDKYLSVAMASIFSKVERDSYMSIISRKYPQFHWTDNKGYGTAIHIDQIRSNSKNEFLRQTFIFNILNSNKLNPNYSNEVTT